MTPLSALCAGELRHRLNSPRGLRLRTGPFTYAIRSPLPDVAAGMGLHYGGHEVVDPESQPFADFHIQVQRPWGPRRFVRRQVQFLMDGQQPFLPLPGDQGYPMLEWGMNWCISSRVQHLLVIHSAVLERGGRALLMPAPSGAGKSTLCAALAWRGWRLLSDELTLLDPATGLLWPLARPVSLKNRSIDVIRAWEPAAVMNEPVEETVKGTVAHMSAPPDAVQRGREPARAGWIVLPRFESGSPLRLEPLPRAQAFMELRSQNFNYAVHGERAFLALASMVSTCRTHRLTYGHLDAAVAALADLPDPPDPPCTGA